jgi:N-acetylglutamate synthase-like GNAT family acetyltransferase
MRSVSAHSTMIRAARVEECAALTGLVRRSKTHWGYDRDFVDAVRDSLTFTAADFDAGPIWVLELDGEVSGVHHIIGSPPEGELSDLWLNPTAIGRGLGRALFRHALETASEGASRRC